MNFPRPARVAVVVSVLALLSACGGPSTTATPATPTPSATPTSAAPAPSVEPSPSLTPVTGRITPIPTDPPSGGTNEVLGDYGTLSPGFTLPHENDPATDEDGPWEPTPWYTSCLDKALVIQALDQLDASRIRQQLVPEGVNGEGLLEFPTDADAAAFMSQLRTGYATCGDAGGIDDGYRTRMASGDVDGPGTTSFAIRTWTEHTADGDTWVVTPGGSIDLLAQQGRYVALTYYGGEIVGDSVDVLTPEHPLIVTAGEILGSV